MTDTLSSRPNHLRGAAAPRSVQIVQEPQARQNVASESHGASGDGRQETELERLDRNLEEMTGELRVMVTGVQVLFAFLLIVPFDSGFIGIGSFERGVYFATLLCSALAALCTIAPSAYHRVLFRQDDKRHLVFVSNRMVIAGLAFLALAMCGSLLLVTSKLFGATAGGIAAGLVALPFAFFWFLAPLRRRAALDAAGQSPGSRVVGEFAAAGPSPGDARQAAKPVRYDSPVGSQENLGVDLRHEQDRVVLRLTGELDLASTPIFERALEDAEIGKAPLVVLDLDGLTFVDSTGLRIILLAHERSRELQQEFAITPGSPQVQRLLSITSVTDHLRVIASPDELLV
jgi:anti-anti-sigma factor